MIGCLYDYGPHFCNDIEDAIDDFSAIFESSIDSDELIDMRNNLRTDGRHDFRNASKAGAHYARINEESGEMPNQEV